MTNGWAPGILLLGALTQGAPARPPDQPPFSVREITWADVAAPVQRLLIARGVHAAVFAHQIAETRRRNEARVREGDLDHLIFYALQSAAYTTLPPIEPALSAAEFVKTGTIPPTARARLAAFAEALERPRPATRVETFRDMLENERAAGVSSHAVLEEQYARAMRFLYDQEFVAGRQADRTTAVGRLYQARGLSTDTSVEVGYVVHLALATLAELDPRRRVRRVLIVGPGIDLAARTDLLEASEQAQSCQPFAVMDALLGLRLADRTDLRMTAVDINPRVVRWLEGARGRTVGLTLASAVAERDGVRFAADFREYFAMVGRSVGVERPAAGRRSGHLVKSIDVPAGATGAVEAARLDIVVERLDRQYDLVVVTNVFPYLSDADLLLALTNIGAMLAPGGVLIHNEGRPMLAEATLALRLSLVHSRSAVIANVEGAPSPLYDAVWVHRAP